MKSIQVNGKMVGESRLCATSFSEKMELGETINPQSITVTSYDQLLSFSNVSLMSDSTVIEGRRTKAKQSILFLVSGGTPTVNDDYSLITVTVNTSHNQTLIGLLRLRCFA